jgi:hypothetical protein
MIRQHKDTPDAAPGQTQVADNIVDKRGFAARWKFSIRQIDNFLAQGMPHLKVGNRRTRILIDEADRWMTERFATRRIGKLTTGNK